MALPRKGHKYKIKETTSLITIVIKQIIKSKTKYITNYKHIRQIYLKPQKQTISNSYHCRGVNSHDPYLIEYKYM